MPTPLRDGLPRYVLGAWQGNVVDDAGVKWAVTSESGWSGGPGVRFLGEEFAQNHGGADGPSYTSPRVVTLSGTALAPDRVARHFAEESLVAAVFGEDLVLEVTTVHAVRSAEVRPSADPQIKSRGARAFDWQITVTAPDPRKYDPEQTLPARLPKGSGGLEYPLEYPLDYGTAGDPGRVTLVNDGSAHTHPRFEVHGPLELGFELTFIESAQVLRYLEPVGESQFVSLDCQTGSVLLDGESDRRSALSLAQWDHVPARSVRTVQFSALGTYQAAAQLIATWAPAHW